MEQMNKIEGWKVFDSNLQCRDYQFEVGKIFEQEGAPVLCQHGFHFCVNLADCFNYYKFDPSNRVCKVVGYGEVATNGGDKVAVNCLEIVEEITWQEVLTLVNSGKGNTGLSNSGDHNSGNYNSGNHNSGNYNSGNHNSGYRNSGYSNSGYSNSGNYNSGDYNSGNYNSDNYNSGDHNSGYSNSGYYNSGYYNSGDYNSGDYNSGYFNTNTPPTIRVFNKEVNRAVYEAWKKPDFLFFDLTEWDEDNQTLVTLDYKEAFLKSWEKADRVDRMRIKDCPNFDEELFFEISGIRVSDYE